MGSGINSGVNGKILHGQQAVGLVMVGGITVGKGRWGGFGGRTVCWSCVGRGVRGLQLLATFLLVISNSCWDSQMDYNWVQARIGPYLIASKILILEEYNYLMVMRWIFFRFGKIARLILILP